MEENRPRRPPATNGSRDAPRAARVETPSLTAYSGLPARRALVVGADSETLQLCRDALESSGGEKSAMQGPRRRLPPPIAAAVLAFAGICAFGALRLAGTTQEAAAGVKLRIMQPNLAQDAKFRPDNKARIMSRYLTMSAHGAGSDRSGLDDVTVLIWPESAFPFILSRDAGALAEIGAVLPQDTVLVTGAARADDEARRSASGRARYFNAIQVIASGGHILDSYDKVHLVPFGEYLPFRTAFDRLGLRQFVPLPGGFEAGSKRRLLVVPGLPAVAPLICYEAIFPGEVVPSEAPRA